MADSRKLKVYEGSGWNYRPVPEIILKGDWLKQYGFSEDTPIHVLCEDGKLTITPRDPDPIPDKIGNILSSLSEKRAADPGEISPKNTLRTELKTSGK